MSAHFVYTYDYVYKVLATTCKRCTFVQTVSLGSGNWQKQADTVLVGEKFRSQDNNKDTDHKPQ